MTMVNEGIVRKLDKEGRISIPKHLRNKYDWLPGDEAEIYTYEKDGKIYVCLAVDKK